jgi:ribosomal protein S18 acetylase RimI-like enzyme
MKILRINHKKYCNLFFKIKSEFIGETKIFFNKKELCGYISNIEVYSKFRNKGYGSIILNKSEFLLNNDYNVNIIKLLAWQKSNENLVDFYKKNNYQIENNINNIYDDGGDIYDLIPMIKYINF